MIYLINGLILLYIQLIFVPYLSDYEISFNILIPFFVWIAIKLPLKKSLYITFFIALLFDLIYPDLLGLGIISSLLITWFVNKYHNNMNKKKFFIVLLAMFIVNVLYTIAYLIYNMFIFNIAENLFISIGLTIVLNTILSTFLVYLFYIVSKIRIFIDV